MSAIARRGAASVKRVLILKYVFLETMSRLWTGVKYVGIFIGWVFGFLFFSLFMFPVGLLVYGITWLVYPPATEPALYDLSLVILAGILAPGVIWTCYVLITDTQAGKSFLADVRRRQQQVPLLTYPEDWDDLRYEVYSRDHYRCGNCGASNVELHAHHIVPLRVGGTNNITNLTTLCRDCHELIHPHMRS